MKEIVRRSLLAGGKVTAETHLRQAGFTCSASAPFTKNKERIQKFKETSRYTYQKKQEKACFQHYMVYWDFKNLSRKATSNKVLRDKAFNIAQNLKYDGCKCGLASMIYKFFW